MRRPRLIRFAALLGLTTLACSDASGPASPAVDQLLFLSSRAGAMSGAETLWDIYRIDGDGSNVVNLTKLPGRYGHLAVTPDGRTVVFEGRRDSDPSVGGDCPTHIWAMGTDGTGLRRITTGVCAYVPRLSPDGKLVSYLRASEVWVIRIDGTGARSVSQALPAVSPTSCGATPQVTVRTIGWASTDRVLFSRHICGSGTTYYSVDAQGSGLTVLNYDAESAYLSPDLRQMVVTRYAGTAATEVSVMNADGSNVRPIVSGGTLPNRFAYERSPWSPDGTRIFYTTSDGQYASGADGTNARKIVDAWPAFRGVFNGWSPDGTRIAFAVVDTAAGDYVVTNINVIGADGTGRVDITRSSARNEQAIWIPRR